MSAKTLALGPFVLDRDRQVLTRAGQPVPIGHRGYVLLETLLDAGGEPVSKQVLMERGWPDQVIEEGNLTVQISALRRQLGVGADALIVTVPRVGYRLVVHPDQPRLNGAGPPLVAVLPFANQGGSSEDDYFVDGVVDDIITALSRFKAFAVVSRGSTFALRDKAPDVRTAVAELGARYAVEGSIRRLGHQLRVTARLLDVSRGVYLWSERYEGAASEIFSVQDHITESIAGVIEPTIHKAEIERVRRKPAASLDAYDLYLKATPLISAAAPEGLEEAIVLLREAAALDPNFALAPAYAAWAHEKLISMRLPLPGNSGTETCIELARTAVRIGGDDPLVRAICGWVLYRVAEDKTALRALRQAARDNPNSVAILILAGVGNTLNGAVDDAFHCYARAYDLSPGAPDAYQCLEGMGCAEMMRGNYETAIEFCLRSLATFNDWLYTYITLATAYAHLDRMDQAKAMVRRIRELHPGLTIKAIEDGAAHEDHYAMAVLPSLRKAGLPER